MTGRGVIEEFDPRDTMSVASSISAVGNDGVRAGDYLRADPGRGWAFVENAHPTLRGELPAARPPAGPNILVERIAASMRPRPWVGITFRVLMPEHDSHTDSSGRHAPLRVHPGRCYSDEAGEG